MCLLVMDKSLGNFESDVSVLLDHFGLNVIAEITDTCKETVLEKNA